MKDNYNKAYKEVLEVLKYLPDESVKKIPQDLLDMFEAEQDESYEFEIDIDKTFEEQELLIETQAILANIFRDYWATDYQREKIIEKEKIDRAKEEQEKREKYNPDDLFKNKKEKKVVENIELEDNSNLPVEVKQEKFFEKLINFIKKIFKFN